MDISLHNYLKELRNTDSSSEYIKSIKGNLTPLIDNNLPIILTLGQLAYAVDVPYKYLNRICNRRFDPYRVFSIRKRSGGKRFICIPDEYLLKTQRWLHEKILCSDYAIKKLSNNVTAYKPDSSHIVNAKRHQGADWILKLDVSNFFESISERQVYYVFKSFGYRALVAFTLARVCTRVLDNAIDNRRDKKRWKVTEDKWKFITNSVLGHLPQGAPTSPMLANYVCINLDNEIQKIASTEELTYTRYADDITLSGSEKDLATQNKLIKEISLILGKNGFKVNQLKTKVIKNGCRKIVTGLLVDGDNIRVPRIYKDKIKMELYFIHKYGLESHCMRIKQKNHVAYLMRLKGKILYVLKIEEKIGKIFIAQFNKEFPSFNHIESMLLK